MGSYTVGAGPVTLKRGRPFAKAMTWQTPAGGVVDVTGFAFAAAVRWNGGVNSAPATLEATNAAAGALLATVAFADTADIPLGQIAHLALTVTDAAGVDHDIELPILCVQP